MSPSPLSRGWSIGLLIGLLVLIGLGLALLGSAVLMPQAGVVGFLVIALTLFLVLQLVVFRAFGLRSKADEDPEAARSTKEDETDWRAWRG